MIEYLGHVLAFLAAIVAIKGDTFNPNNSGLAKVTFTGWIAGCIAVVGLVTSVLIVQQNNRDRAEIVGKLEESEERENVLIQSSASLRKNVESLQSALADTTGRLKDANTKISDLDKQIEESAIKQAALTSVPEISLGPEILRYYEDQEAVATLKNWGGQINDLKIIDRTLYEVQIRNAQDCPALSFEKADQLYDYRNLHYYPAENTTVSYEGSIELEDRDLYSFDLLALYKEAEKIEKNIYETGGFRNGCIDIRPFIFVNVSMKSYSGASIEWYGKYSFEHARDIDFRMKKHSFDEDEWEKVDAYASKFNQRYSPISMDTFAAIALRDMDR